MGVKSKHSVKVEGNPQFKNNKISIQANRYCRDGVATVSKLLVDQLGLDNILSKIVKIRYKWIIYCLKKLNSIMYYIVLYYLL